MPVVNGRLTCCVCGSDLGDAEDPYRDPSCRQCLDRENVEDAVDEYELSGGDEDELIAGFWSRFRP